MTIRLVRIPAAQTGGTSNVNLAEIESRILNNLDKDGWQLLSIAGTPNGDVIAAMERKHQ